MEDLLRRERRVVLLAPTGGGARTLARQIVAGPACRHHTMLAPPRIDDFSGSNYFAIRTLGPTRCAFTSAHLDEVLTGSESQPLRDAVLQYWRDRPLDRAAADTAFAMESPTHDQLAARLADAGITPGDRALSAALDRLEINYVLVRGEAEPVNTLRQLFSEFTGARLLSPPRVRARARGLATCAQRPMGLWVD